MKKTIVFCLLLGCLALLLYVRFGATAPASGPEPAETVGEAVEPSAQRSENNSDGYADTLPAFGRHVAYLFPDEFGFLHPEEPLSRENFARAMRLLAYSEDELKLPEGEGSVGTRELRDALQPFFTTEKLAALPETESISRADFALLLFSLLDREETERVALAAGAELAPDIPSGAAEEIPLLEASLPHEVSPEGLTWAEAAASAARSPGMLFLAGRLYCLDANGRLLRDGSCDGLYFGQDGLYSSGDEELDADIAEILRAICEEYPADAYDRMAMLRHIYDHMLHGYTYRGLNSHVDGEGWENRDGKLMLETGRGDCYNYAAAFTVLARSLGFPAQGIIRSLDMPDNLHAWTDIVIDGIPYIFDPQLEIHFGNDRFMLTYEQGARYGYKRPEMQPGM